jgi:hypothetical protein
MAAVGGMREPVPGRRCGTCTLCCKVNGVVELSKPMGAWCRHCVRTTGCAIYEGRPHGCRVFYCEWMLEPALGPEWKPDRARFALTVSDDGHRITAMVDPGYPSAWRRPPYYEKLKQWAAGGAHWRPQPRIVDAMIGLHYIAILPDRDIDLGALGDDELLQVHIVRTASGEGLDVRKIKRAAA